MKSKEVISKLTQVYLNYGIVPIGGKPELDLPEVKQSIKIEAVFDDYDKVQLLTYDPLQKRFFGVKGWYKTHNAKPGDAIVIEPVIPGKRYRFRFCPKKYEEVLLEENLLERIKVSKKSGRGISIVGKPINYGGLIYGPVNELGVVLLFGMIFEELGIIVEEVKSGFPDATIRRFNGKGWTRELVEFEYESLNFKQHNHSVSGCDMIICWSHNWKDCPLEVCEMEPLLKLLPRDKLEKVYPGI
ncbi:hypothetical protein HY768_06875 [candidate division TA06 bacterium]|uniref:Uncharacterized protein n=1 Tax=candidate division TA06 bacterium TaxID=2250710 RepID=A0A933MIB2_UNCT6|nr:hypothetical protein [candidate division TA06 bacterium]